MPKRASAADRVLVEFRKAIAAVILFNDQVASHTGMSASESQFLHLLTLHGPLTPSEFVRHSGLTSGSVTGVLDRLEGLGLVRRDRHPDDRRKVIVSVVGGKLEETYGALFEGQAAAFMETTRHFTAAELDTVADFLNRVVASAPKDVPLT